MAKPSPRNLLNSSAIKKRSIQTIQVQYIYIFFYCGSGVCMSVTRILKMGVSLVFLKDLVFDVILIIFATNMHYNN